MDIKNIPVSFVGPGSQTAEDAGETLSYIDMPGNMSTYREPCIPEPAAVINRAGAREAMLWLRRALADYGKTTEPLLADLSGLDEKNRELVNQILGEGEVSVRYNGAFKARTQEAVLAGVWRTLYLDQDDRVRHDILEVADAPHIVRMPEGRNRPIDASMDDAPAGVINALPILVELQSYSAQYEESSTVHVINLTLLPVSAADLEFLDQRLGRGPVDTLSRAYGKCQVINTLTPNVWWVRYYNSMGTLILNTLEVVAVPAVIRAAPEDLRDSLERLRDILTPYWSDVA
jgi:hydrogenase-1 operon protein HyaF